MSPDEQKAMIRRFVDEAFNGGNMAVCDELIAPDAIDHAAPPGVAPGREGVKQVILMFRAAFPDLHETIEDMVAEGDRVCSRATLRGTHRGAFMGMAPTGKSINVGGIDIIRFAGDKMAEHWAQQDVLGMLQQLGAIPVQ